MGGSLITSNKPLMEFTGTDPEYSVEDYSNAVTANLILIIGPEPINTTRHQNWIKRRTSVNTNNTRWRSSKMVFSITHRNKIRLEKIYTRIFKIV